MHHSIERALASVAVAALVAAGPVQGQPTMESTASSLAPLHWFVRIAEPRSGLVHVRGEIPAEALDSLASLTLRFADHKRRPEGINTLRAWSEHRPLKIEQPSELAANVWHLELDHPTAPVVVEYTVDPTYYPPGSRAEHPEDARSRVSEAFAVLRTTSLFPALNVPNGPVRISFTVPEGWIVATPWQTDADGFATASTDLHRVDYLGVGPFEIRELRVGETLFRIAVPRQETRLTADDAVIVIQFELDLIGTPPPGNHAVRTVIIVPPRFMRGGAAGMHSVVQRPSPEVLAHEVFHWWTHSDLARPEARWLTEGFTNYYGIRVARDTGLMPEEDAERCLSDLFGEMRYLEQDSTQSLATASLRYDRDSRARRLVYSKGALFALFLDQQLALHDLSLDEGMRTLLSEPRQSLTNADLRQLLQRVYAHRMDASFENYVEGKHALPDLGLGDSTGRSGCARYLPNQ
ncbi:MAG: hypothetical protein ACE5G0_00715 [Rhodothermales bacterium]